MPVAIPRYYRPRPYQQACWMRRASGRYNYYFKIWARQLGKDTDDIENALYYSWRHPGTTTAYVGLDNKWVDENIFKKVLDGRRFWDDFPREHIDPKDTHKEVVFVNNPPDRAEARIKFIGFKNDQALIGSSYDRFVISEASLYGPDAFQYIEPIWENKLAEGKDLAVWLNGTPRGLNNVYADLLAKYTGVDDHSLWPGEHVNGHYSVFVDKVTIEDAMVPDGHGGYRRLYSPERIEKMREDAGRKGTLELFNQEYMCDFTTVNAGLVYRGVEALRKEGRYSRLNLDTQEPVYVAFDIASKAKTTDATAGVVYQKIGGTLRVYDVIEQRGLALVEVIAELAARGYWQYVRVGFLPWDSERSASSETPIEEARRLYPQIMWHALEKERVDRGIELVRQEMPNMWVNSERCAKLNEAFDAYEYKLVDAEHGDFSAKPVHNWASHLMDALRYAVMGLRELEYLGLPMDGARRKMPDHYDYFGDSGRAEASRPDRPLTMMTERERRAWLRGGGRDTGQYI